MTTTTDSSPTQQADDDHVPARDPARRLGVVTGASRGLGRALAGALARAGWDLVLDARTEHDLLAAVAEVRTPDVASTVRAVVGDVTDPAHRRRLAATAAEIGAVDLLVNNASTLGPSPLPRLVDLAPDELAELLAVNTVAPLAVFQALAPHLAPDATVVNVTSDASVGAWEGWGGYGLSKAALDHLSAVLAVEHPGLAVHAVDPGDLRTAMHQAAFPGEDISDRPLPEAVVDDLVALVEARPASGRHRLSDWSDPESSPADGEVDGDQREVAA